MVFEDKNRFSVCIFLYIYTKGGLLVKKIKFYITPEQTTILKKIDSLTYLKDFEPNSIIKEGRIYKSTIHDGLIINKKGWKWKSKNLSGKCAVDYLVYVEHFSFMDALHLLFDCYLSGGKYA